LSEHEHQSTDDDGDQCERPSQGPGERQGQIAGGALPRRLCEGGCRKEKHRKGRDCRPPDHSSEAAVHVTPPATRSICYYTSLRMPQGEAITSPRHPISAVIAKALGARRSARLRGVMRLTGLPAEALLDLALELLDISSRRLSPPPIRRQALGLG